MVAQVLEINNFQMLIPKRQYSWPSEWQKAKEGIAISLSGDSDRLWNKDTSVKAVAFSLGMKQGAHRGRAL
eukprot:scaffold55772_cov33-Prasinocladus_malaysianus.AAC.1